MTDSGAPGLPPAGWYDDPEAPGGKRWWSGAAWTEHRQPAPPPQAVQQPAAWAPVPQQHVPPAHALPTDASPAYVPFATAYAASSEPRAVPVQGAPLPPARSGGKAVSIISAVLGAMGVLGGIGALLLQLASGARGLGAGPFAGNPAYLGGYLVGAFALPVLALLLGLIGRSQSDPGSGVRTAATWGLVLGAVGVLIGLARIPLLLAAQADQSLDLAYIEEQIELGYESTSGRDADVSCTQADTSVPVVRCTISEGGTAIATADFTVNPDGTVTTQLVE